MNIKLKRRGAKVLVRIVITALLSTNLNFIIAPRIYAVVPPMTMTAPDIWAGYALLKRIASCESWGDPNKEPRQFLPNGSVLRGYPNPDDIGLAQINVPTWGGVAKKLGFNIYTYNGNLAMAKWIFDNDSQHQENWHWSEGCWGK